MVMFPGRDAEQNRWAFAVLRADSLYSRFQRHPDPKHVKEASLKQGQSLDELVWLGSSGELECRHALLLGWFYIDLTGWKLAGRYIARSRRSSSSDSLSHQGSSEYPSICLASITMHLTSPVYVFGRSHPTSRQVTSTPRPSTNSPSYLHPPS